MNLNNKAAKTVKTILRTSLLTLTALIIGLNLYTINAERLAGNAVPMPFGVGGAVVLSGSMEPTLSVGDLLIIAEKENYRPRDIIVYQDAKIAVTHRIVSINGDEIITKGDANDSEDKPITQKHIKGKVVMAIPLVGYLVNAIKTPLGTMCIIALAIFLLERSFHKDNENDGKELDKIRQEIEALKEQLGQNNQSND